MRQDVCFRERCENTSPGDAPHRCLSGRWPTPRPAVPGVAGQGGPGD